MLTIQLPPDVRATITAACRRAGARETGGMLFAEHVGTDAFRVVQATVAGTGSVASFVRGLLGGLEQLTQFFHRTKHDYRRFNYLGEWHSHPSFELYPSATDDRTMFDIVTDPATAARFAVSLIVKIADGSLSIRGYGYFPDGTRSDVEVVSN